MTVTAPPRPPVPAPPPDLQALIEEARRRARRRRVRYGALVLAALSLATGLFFLLGHAGASGSPHNGFEGGLGVGSGAAIKTVKFKPYTFGYVRDGFLDAARPRDRILIARTPAQGLRWDKWITHRQTTAPQYADFASQALVGIFLLNRRSFPFPQPGTGSLRPPRPSDVNGVVVRSLARSNGTLLLTLAVSPFPVELCGPGLESPNECFQPSSAPSLRYHALTIVAVAREALAHVRRVVVTQEVSDPNPLQVHFPDLCQVTPSC